MWSHIFAPTVILATIKILTYSFKDSGVHFACLLRIFKNTVEEFRTDSLKVKNPTTSN